VAKKAPIDGAGVFTGANDKFVEARSSVKQNLPMLAEMLRSVSSLRKILFR
jgi:hypothetical protein